MRRSSLSRAVSSLLSRSWAWASMSPWLTPAPMAVTAGIKSSVFRISHAGIFGCRALARATCIGTISVRDRRRRRWVSDSTGALVSSAGIAFLVGSTANDTRGRRYSVSRARRGVGLNSVSHHFRK